MVDPQQAPRISDPTYQDRDIRIGMVMGAVVISLVITALTFVGMQRLFARYDKTFLETDDPISPLAVERVLPTNAVLQVYEAADLLEHRAGEDALLHHYAWIDREAGVVQIPIDRAMELIAVAGPDEEKKNPPAATDSTATDSSHVAEGSH